MLISITFDKRVLNCANSVVDLNNHIYFFTDAQGSKSSSFLSS